MKLGATGKFPEGKLDPTDEGEAVIAISATEGGMIRIDFGKRVAWVAFSAKQAIELAGLLVKHARRVFDEEEKAN